MSSKIFYKFSSQEVGPIGEVNFTGQTMRLADLKREIMDKLAQGQSEYAEFDLEITDSETHKTYTDEARLVPKNATVFIRRIPVTTITARRLPYATGGARQTAPVVKVERPTGGGGSDDFQDVFVARPDAALPSGDLNITINTSSDPPEGLSKEEEAIQRMVRVSGTSNAPGISVPSAGTGPRGFAGLAFRAQPGTGAALPPKPKKAIGIPKEMLATPTEGGEQGISRIQVRPDESFDQKVKTQGVKVMSEDEVRKRLKADQSIHVPEELRCSISNELLKEAVRLPCCLRPCSFEKISNALLANGLACPLCKRSPITVDTLKADKLLRDKVNGFLNEVRIRLEKAQEATLATNAQKARNEDVPLPSNNKSDIVLDLSSRGDKIEPTTTVDNLLSEPNVSDPSTQAGTADDEQQEGSSHDADGRGDLREQQDDAQHSGSFVAAGYAGPPMGAYGMYGRPSFAPGAPFGGAGGYYPPQPWMGPRGLVPRGPPYGWQPGPPGAQSWSQPRGPMFHPQAGPVPPGWQGRPPRFGGPAFRGGPRPPFAPGFRGPFHPRPHFAGARPPPAAAPIEATEREPDSQADQEENQLQMTTSDRQENPESKPNASPENVTGELHESTREDSQGRESNRRDRSPAKDRQRRRRSRDDRQSTGRRRSPDRRRRARSPSPPRRKEKESEVSRRTDDRSQANVNKRDDDHRKRGDRQGDRGGPDRRGDREPGGRREARPADERRDERDRRRRSRERADRGGGPRREDRAAGRGDADRSQGSTRDQSTTNRDAWNGRHDRERRSGTERDREGQPGLGGKKEASTRRGDSGQDPQQIESSRRRGEKSREVHNEDRESATLSRDEERHAGRTKSAEHRGKVVNAASDLRESTRPTAQKTIEADAGSDLEGEEDWELYEEGGDEDDGAAGSPDANTGPQGAKKRRFRGGRRRGEKKRRK